VRPSPTARSTDPAAEASGEPPGVDVYLLPAIVGGGLGDIEEVLCAGRALARAGARPILYRRAGAPLPTGVDGPWHWPPLDRPQSIHPRAARALTVAPAWGITCAPGRPGPYGRPGPWAAEAAEIERTYGADRTVHVSLEEFARTLTTRDESIERLREGGVRRRKLSDRLAQARNAGEIDAYRQAFRGFRAFDRSNVLHLFATFRYDRPFGREYPEAVQVGPLWPSGCAPGPPPERPAGSGWVWYASPASAETIAPAVIRGLHDVPSPPHLFVRTPRPWAPGIAGPRVTVRSDPLAPTSWSRRFRSAALRIVTGSRSLLEALEVGGPFLYFNGVLGQGSARRRHRPEKIARFLEIARSSGWPPDLVNDLAAFSSGRRVALVSAAAAQGQGGWRRFPSPPRPLGFARGFDDAAQVLVRCAGVLGEGRLPASELVADLRRRSHA